MAEKLGYEVDEVINLISRQSPEINAAVSNHENIGAGDQGMMYGYATRETESRLPYGFELANRIIWLIEDDKQYNPYSPYKGDAKCQVTVDLDSKGPDSVKKVLVSVCHEQMCDIDYIRYYTMDLLAELDLPKRVQWIINPSGAWTIGGPVADCGLTGRKIVCDQYGGYCPVGGGAFSGKDPTKVDRSGAYMARKIACDILDEFGVDAAEVQLAYAIGMAEPMSINVRLKPDIASGAVENWIRAKYDLTPRGIIKSLDLLKPKYEYLAEGCHYRRERQEEARNGKTEHDPDAR